MAAAYAALLSLSHILHQILNSPPTHHLKFPRETAESLRDIVSSLLGFLETCPSRRSQEIEDLEEQIVCAAYEAEDILESHVVRRMLMKSAARTRMKSFALFCRSMQMAIGTLLPIQKVSKKVALLKVIEDFISIRKEVDEFKITKGVEDVIPENYSTTNTSTSLPVGDNMVGFVEHLDRIRIVLASDDLNLVTLPIVGMGGIGKSTLASNVYADPYIIERFDIRAWVRVSQEYHERLILIALLQQINSNMVEEGLSIDELGVRLHKELFGRRYLIVIDDIWEIQAMERLQKFFPDNSTNSRVLVTTRRADLARLVGSCSPHEMSLLDEDKSWDLIHKYVKEDYPIELIDIGKSIARGCRGLPLALVVIGGLLAQSEKTRDFWVYVEKNVSSTASDENCLTILRLSYSQLPVHLKPCFLYLAVFPQYFEIRVSRLIRLWVAEGFIKASEGKSLEEVAQGYLKDLVDRNLVMISKRGQSGKVKNCIIHDLIRELCVLEAQKNKFLCIAKVADPSTSQQLESAHRLCIHTSTGALRLGLHNRSLLSYSALESRTHIARRLNLLRVLDVVDLYSMDEIMLLFNSRYITCAIPREFHISSFMSLLWNLQTLVLSRPISLPCEFWQMPQLRHLKIPGITLANPLHDDDDFVVLENMQTLATIKDFIFSENVVRRIPNLKKLGIDCDTAEGIGSFCLSNLASSLDKLETLVLTCRGTWENMAFPNSLKKLTLSQCQIPWDDMFVVGSLPNLEVLKLLNNAAKGRKWSTNAGEFLRLKFLLIDWCQLEIWEADEIHFRSLEHLQLVRVRLEEFPAAFAEISTLRTIDLNYCSEALSASAKTMSRDREDFGYDVIQIRSFPSQPMQSRQANVVGLEDEVEKIIGYLNDKTAYLDVIPIVGILGLGKTMITRKIFHDPTIAYEFPTRIWVYVSSEFKEKDVFLSILVQMKTMLHDGYYDRSAADLAKEIAAALEGGKFLLVMDDVWEPSDWDMLRAVLPKYNVKGKVLITSRHEGVGRRASRYRAPHKLRYLNLDESYELLRQEVFCKAEFPSDLVKVGKEIAGKCEGLPIALVMIGGVLATKVSESTAAWENFSESVTSIIHHHDLYQQMYNIVSMSYEKLCHPLKDCFLYLGMFPEYFDIPTWELMQMWIAEGLIPATDDISLEERAELYLDELINTNLVRIERLKADGSVKTCRIHNMLRDFCKREGGKEGNNFFQEVKESGDGGLLPPVIESEMHRRLCIHSSVLNFLSKNPIGPCVHSFVTFSEDVEMPTEIISAISAAFKELRVLEARPLKFKKIPNDFHLVHLRYLSFFLKCVNNLKPATLPPAFNKLWNLQTLIVNTASRTLEAEADLMSLIEFKHLKTNVAITLAKPGKASTGGEKLQTLCMMSPESCTEEILDRARDLKKLVIRGKVALFLDGKIGSIGSLRKLAKLEKLKLENDVFPSRVLAGKLSGLPSVYEFPPALRILTLKTTSLDWTHMSVLALLSNLQVLKLQDHAFVGSNWTVDHGGFDSLEFLHIERTDLKIWEVSAGSFRNLKRLELHCCGKLKQIPIAVADIPKFEYLDIYHCREAASSAMKIALAKVNVPTFKVAAAVKFMAVT